MPRSAIASDVADRVLAVEAMPDALLVYLRHDYIARAGDLATPPWRMSGSCRIRISRSCASAAATTSAAIRRARARVQWA
jgi:hypothetical protein